MTIDIDVDTGAGTKNVDVLNRAGARIRQVFTDAGKAGGQAIDQLTARMATAAQSGVRLADTGQLIRAAFSGNLSAISGFVGSLSAGVLAAGLLAGGVALLGKAMLSMADHAGEAAERLGNLSVTTGLSVREIQELQIAATASGVGTGSLVTSMKTLNEALSENSTEGRKAKLALKELGVEAFDGLGRVRAGGKIIEEVALKLAQIENPAEKARLAFHLFGKGFKDLLPVLAQYPELIKLIRASGAVISDDDIKRAQEYDARMDAVKIRLEGIYNLTKNKVLVIVDTIIAKPLVRLMDFLERQRNQEVTPVQGTDQSSVAQLLSFNPHGTRRKEVFDPSIPGASQNRFTSPELLKDRDIRAGNRLIDGAVNGNSIEAVEQALAVARQGRTDANRLLGKGKGLEESRKRIADFNNAVAEEERLKTKLENLRFAESGAPKAAAEQRKRAADFATHSSEKDLGGIRAIEIQRDKLLHDLGSAGTDSKGNERRIAVSAEARANVEKGIQDLIRVEQRKTDAELRDIRRKADADRTKVLIDQLKRNEVAEEDSLAIQLAGETLTRREVEDRRLALRRESLAKIAKLEADQISANAALEITKLREKFSREAAANPALRAQQQKALDSETAAIAAKAGQDINRVNRDASAGAKHGEDSLSADRIERDKKADEASRDFKIATQQEVARHGITALGQERDRQLDNLNLVQARSLNQKLALEQAKLAIEVTYLAAAAAAEQKIRDKTHERELERIRERGREQGLSQPVIDAQAANETDRHNKERDNAAIDTSAAIASAQRKAAIEGARLIQDQNLRIFESLKNSANGVLDQIFSKSKSVFGAIGDAFKAAILTAIKSILSSQIAAALTKLVTGQAPSFSGGPGGGGFGAALAGLGLGVPSFAGGGGGGGIAGGGGFGGGGFSIPGLTGAPGGTVGFSGPVAQLSAATGLPPAVIAQAAGGGSTTTLSGIGGTGIGVFNGAAGAASGGKGSILTGLKNQLSSIGNIGSKFSSAHGGVNGAAGGALLAGGGILAFDGLRRGGLKGLAETTAGGALIGAKFGGPVGAAIGAGVGFVAGLIRLSIKGRDEQVQKQVKDLYGLDISRAYAQQIDQIAKQTYGGSISTAIRSPQVVEMLSLYAQATGQQFGIANTPRGAAATQTGGHLFQSAGSYVNGQGIGFKSSLASDSSISRYIAAGPAGAPLAVSIQMDAKQTSRMWEGAAVQAIGNNPAAVADASLTASNNSNGRRELTNNGISPNNLLR